MLELIGTELVQWDLDVQMRITTDQKVDEVHFANIGDAVALVVKPKTNNGETIVDVPNILLQTSRNLMAYVWADGRTIRRISFGIKSKPKPEGYAYKETEILNYRTLEERIQILEKNVGDGTAARIGFQVEYSEKKTNKTYDEVVQAYSKGQIVVLNDIERSKVFYLSSISSTMIVFTNLEGVNYEGIFLMPNNFCASASWKVAQKTEIPTVNDILNALPTWQGGAY